MGDPPSLKDTYREHYRFVWRVVRRLGVPDAAVEDAVQEVFVVVHRRRNELDWSGSHRGLLYGIARKVASRTRERAARPAPQLHVVAGNSDDPQRRVEVEEAAAVVREALDTMDEGKRMAFLLVDVEGMSVTDVADCHQINLNTAHARLRAARQQIKKAIARHRAKEEGDHVRATSH